MSHFPLLWITPLDGNGSYMFQWHISKRLSSSFFALHFIYKKVSVCVSWLFCWLSTSRDRGEGSEHKSSIICNVFNSKELVKTLILWKAYAYLSMYQLHRHTFAFRVLHNMIKNRGHRTSDQSSWTNFVS